MCYRLCIDKGSCTKDLEGEVRISADGLILQHRSPDRQEWRAHYKGDATWSKSGRSLVEYHNADVCAMIFLYKVGKAGAANCDVRKHVADKLSNHHLSDPWVFQRLASLVRHGFVSKSASARYTLTDKGISELAKVAAARLTFKV